MPTLVLLLHLCAADVSLFTFVFQAPSAGYDVMQVMAPIHIVVKGLNSADFFSTVYRVQSMAGKIYVIDVQCVVIRSDYHYYCLL